MAKVGTWLLREILCFDLLSLSVNFLYFYLPDDRKIVELCVSLVSLLLLSVLLISFSSQLYNYNRYW